MSALEYTKSARYTQPAWTPSSEFIDGIYVNGLFFEENIPILGARLGISVKPSKHLRQRTITFSVPTFQAGKVLPVMRLETWWWNADDERSIDIDFANSFYGMGLNTIFIITTVDLFTDDPVVYNVNYALEVYY